MEIEQLIDDEIKKQLSYKTKLVKKRQLKRNKEILSQREIEDLIGINRDIYARGKGGALRRK
jgi:hypothetical protein